jgi:hypothetical protein
MKFAISFICVFLFSIFLIAEDDFDTFDDSEMSFVIKTTKPKIIVKKDSKEEEGAVRFKESKSSKNSAVEMKVKNFLIFSKLKDIDARYLVLDVSMENLLKKQRVIVSEGVSHTSSWINKKSDEYTYREAIPPYRIPDLKKHLYLSVNNKAKKPIDMISILLDKPFLPFNTNEITVYPKKEKSGQLAFRLPKNVKVNSLSLHYYDTRYGNIEIPILGELKEEKIKVTSLPVVAWEKMSDNFSISVSGYDIEDEIEGYKAKKDGQFEIVEIDIESKVYALLEFDPAKRFYLEIGDGNRVGLHPITQALPLGLYSSVSLSPGANNKFRLAFYVPKGLENLSRSLRMEIHGKDALLAIKDGKNSLNDLGLTENSINGISLKVNGIYRYDEKIAVNITFNDKEDAYSTRLHQTFHLLKKKDSPYDNSNKAENRDNEIYALKESSVVLNGSKKNVWIWFDNPFNKSNTEPVYLVSSLFNSLNMKIDKNPPLLPDTLKYSLVEKYPYRHKEDKIDKKVLAKVEAFKIKKFKEVGKNLKKDTKRIAKLKNKSDATTISPLGASFYGEKKLESIKTVADMLITLKKIQWIPSAYEPTAAIYSASSMLTQGWGSENEMFKAVYNMVKENNVKFGSYVLSDAGRIKLLKDAGQIPVNKKVPFIEWQDKGEKHTLVFPFLDNEDNIKQYVGKKTYMTELVEKKAHIEMTLTYEPVNDGTSVGSFGSFGGALGGATSTEQTDVIFKKSWNLDEVSDMPVDIYFPGTTATYTDSTGTHQDIEHALNAKKVLPDLLSVQITMPDGKLDIYEHNFKDKEELQDVFYSFSFSSPDLFDETLRVMEKARVEKFKDIKNIERFSTLQWVNRIKIYKFIALQTKYESYLEDVLGVVAKRNRTSRVIMAIVEKTADKKLVSTLDLRSVFSDVYGETKHNQSFNLMSGIYFSKAEAEVLNKGKGFFELLEEQRNTKLLILPLEEKRDVIKWMKGQNISKKVIARYSSDNKNIWLFPMEYSTMKAWLEIDKVSYRTLSVLENGQYGSMAERATLEEIENIAQYALGLLAGVDFSVLSVATFSLVDANYCNTLKSAESLANTVGCGLAIGTFGMSPSVMGAATTTLGCKGKSKAAKIVSFADALNQGVAGAMGGFANGFGDAVSIYFAVANGKTVCKK